MSQTTIPSTFRDLFDIEDFLGVEIPIIQRDYAQGRPTATDVRDQFIHSLHEALTLPSDSPRLPLDLDFIYGSMDNSDLGKVFSPLDGQQRLTALFLLHWYLAVNDGKLGEFRTFMSRGHQSRFSYKVRASADDFFDTLANADFILPKLAEGKDGDGEVITKAIQDQPWFFLAWRQDPTVASTLRVLDTIHKRFKGTKGLFERLMDREHPVITFQFLNLRDFGLSDELYIKMNARGKALTEFEAFKARLEHKIDGLLMGREYFSQGRKMSPKEYFSHRVDSVWADVFWHYRDDGARSYDQQFMNYVRGLVMVTFPYAMRDADARNVNDTMRTLSDNNQHFNFYRYETKGCLTTEFAEMLISVLDQISANGHELKPLLPSAKYYDEQSLFTRILRQERRGVLQAEWIQFYGYCAYLLKFSPDAGEERFGEWMRLVSNLALNTIYGRVDDFIRALVGVRTLLENMGDTPVIKYLASRQESATGFNQQQWREERLKAQLMLRDPEWREVLLTAETHGYFKGQIEFLLDFSGVLTRWNQNSACDWSNEDDVNYRVAFKSQYERAAAIFGSTGLKTFDAFVWERVLLSYGDYLLPNGRNLSLLDNEDREASWKRLLRGSYKGDDGLRAKRELVRSALAVVDPVDVRGSLERRIQQYLATEDKSSTAWWLRLLVECPYALAYCKKRFMRNAGQDGLFLLQKERTSAYHAELRTYHLAHVTLPKMQNRGALSAFSSINYTQVCGEESLPGAMLVAKTTGLKLTITFQASRFHVIAKMSEKSPDGIFEKLFAEHGFFHSAEDVLVAGRSVPIEGIEGLLEGMSECLSHINAETSK